MDNVIRFTNGTTINFMGSEPNESKEFPMDKPVPEMVERVARAMARWNYPGGSDRDIDEMWEGWVGEAIAAIKAMREPMLGMDEAFEYSKCHAREDDRRNPFDRAWAGAIDAALGDHDAATPRDA